METLLVLTAMLEGELDHGSVKMLNLFEKYSNQERTQSMEPDDQGFVEQTRAIGVQYYHNF